MRLGSFFLLALLAGCSSKSDEQPANDAATDSGTDSTSPAMDARPDVVISPDAVYPEFTCGPGPYVDEELKVFGQTLGAPSKTEPKKMQFTLSACPEVKGQTDDEGYAVLHVTKGQPNSIELQAAGFLRTRWYEFTPETWEDQRYWGLVESGSKAQLPGLDAGGTILVDVSAPATSTCSNDGVVVSVDGHPEAVVKYHSSSAPFAPDDAAMATNGGGIVTISGLTGVTAGTKLKVVGSKSGCVVDTLATPGGITIEPGVVSRVELLVRNPLPTCGPPPWVLLEATVAERSMDGSAGSPIADATVDFLGCGTTISTKSDASGLWHVWTAAGIPVIRRVSMTDYLTAISSEQRWTEDYAMLNAALRKATDWTPLMPNYDATHGYAIVGIAAPTAGTCAGADGVEITVKGHPDAKVIYADGEPPKDTKGSATTKKGYAYLSGLTPGPLAKDAVTGKKGTSCTYALEGGADTGLGKIEAGAVTSMALYATVVP